MFLCPKLFRGSTFLSIIVQMQKNTQEVGEELVPFLCPKTLAGSTFLSIIVQMQKKHVIKLSEG